MVGMVDRCSGQPDLSFESTSRIYRSFRLGCHLDRRSSVLFSKYITYIFSKLQIHKADEMLDRLPDLPTEQILSRLSHEDRLSLRRTCKTLKCLIDGQEPRNLFVFLDCRPYHVRLFHTDELLFYADSCRIPDFERFISNAGKEHFQRVRKLAIYFQDLKAIFNALDRLEIDLSQLNYFQEVEHLEIKVSCLRLVSSMNQVYNQIHIQRDQSEYNSEF